MKEKNILTHTVNLRCYNIKDIPEKWQELCRCAQSAADAAYAVYSGFRVGAAVLLEDGSIIKGNNQENAAYPSGLCAERVALFYARAHAPEKKIQAIAIYSPDAKSLLTPCGSCRQVMLEYENLQKQNMLTLILSKQDIYVLESVKDWLPFEFYENLKRE